MKITKNSVEWLKKLILVYFLKFFFMMENLIFKLCFERKVKFLVF